ncbi:hypothetical protein [Cedecea neteri]|uniref:Uncharacterized protein n=1 Tax=Cedecea neteri TaxID=158822 RepID=A0A291DY15_9ENTR|nr:hypothetical protein [Cedecea neteri]ATF92623.1 hypothetical protein CO704_11255 [Cedecea neteri]
MFTSRERSLGKLVVERFRKRRAERINNLMVKEGAYWYDNFITRTSLLEGLSLLIPGLKFGEDVNDFRDLGNSNYRALLRALDKLDDHELQFFKTFINSHFYVCHATNNPAIATKKDMVLFSRRKLIEQDIKFNTYNTAYVDIAGLANDDNVFFSLEIGARPQKTIPGAGGSRFGNTYYKVAYTDPSFDFSSLYLFDQALMDIPQCKISDISEEAKAILNSRKYTRKSICFYGRKSLPALALSIISATRLLPERDRLVLLGCRTEKEKNELLRYLFRIEIRVPRLVGIKHGGYYRFARKK